MTTPEALTELADRVEREEPSFALERLIMYAVYDVRPEHQSAGDKPKPYTTSLDSAVTLIKPDWEWSMSTFAATPNYAAHAMCSVYAEAAYGACDSAPLPAQALTAAALRARAADMQASAVGAPHPARTA